MPIRIYALAKELKIDSKELVDVCAKAGITGKGSALASLADEEIDRVKAFLQGGGRKSDKAPIPPSGPPATPIRTMAPVRPAAPAPPVPPAEPVPQSEPVTPAPAPAPVTPPVPTTSGPTKSAPPLSGFSREDYIAPAASSGSKPRVIVAKGSSDRAKDGTKDARPPQKKEPVVRVAAIPEPPRTTKAPDKNEPTPQKPIMTLPADAIRKGKEGKRAPLEQFTKQQDKKQDRGGAGGRAQPGAAQPSETPSRGSHRDRRRGRDTGGPESETGEKDKKLASMAGSRASRQQKRRRTNTRTSVDDDQPDIRRRRRRLQRRGGTNTAAPRKGKVVIDLPCTVRSLSEATGVPNGQHSTGADADGSDGDDQPGTRRRNRRVDCD